MKEETRRTVVERSLQGAASPLFSRKGIPVLIINVPYTMVQF